MTVEIKICGITSREDALVAVESGADAIGFIFHRQSPRYVAPAAAARIVESVAGRAATVGVFVDAPLEAVLDIVTGCRLDFVQLHGGESPEYCRRFPPSRVVKAFAPRDENDLADLDRYDVRAVLIDTHDVRRHGGTGRPSNWTVAAAIAKCRPLILAGGLGPENVADAIACVLPHAVDINSGVERSPGRKDAEKIGDLVRQVRRSDLKRNVTGIFRRGHPPAPLSAHAGFEPDGGGKP